MAKSKSIAEETKLASVDVGGLPSALSSFDDAPPVQPLYDTSPYVSLVSLRGSTFPKIAPMFPDLKEGDPVLFRGEPHAPLRLAPFRFYFLRAFVHYSESDDTGVILRSSLDPAEARKDRNLKEHVETCLIAVTPAGLVPARCTFKTTKTKAAWAAINALEEAKDGAKWGAKSPEHQATLGCPQPRFRFTSTLQLQYGVKFKTGNSGTLASCVIKPTTLPDWQALTAALHDESFRAAAAKCLEQHNSRVIEITNGAE